MAPELIKRESYSEVPQAHQTVDMFGVALVTYVLFFRKHPFEELVQSERVFNRHRHVSCDFQFPEGVCSE